MINSENRERRDWTLLIFIIPIGIILIILVGQLAVRLVPFWRVDAGMNSNLEPNPESARPFALLEPILPQILTPMAWAQTYLTPGAEISFPPFLTFEPTASPSPTTATPTGTDTTLTPTATTPSPTSTAVTGTPDGTKPPGGGGGGTPPPNEILGCTDPSALNYNPLATVDDGSCTYDILGCTDPSASNFNPAATVDDGSCTYDILGCTDPSASNFNPAATVDDGSCAYPIVSTPDPSYTLVTPPPNIGTVAPDGNIGSISDGNYILIDFFTNWGVTIDVLATPDAFYDLVLYEAEWVSGGGNNRVELDHIVVGITNNISLGYYEVFNWGNIEPDTNTNVDVDELPADPDNCSSGGECDNRKIPLTELYDPDDSGPAPSTGILIDVDTAPAAPPPDSYNFVVIISPNIIGSSGNGAQVDAIVVTEIPIPTPTPTP